MKLIDKTKRVEPGLSLVDFLKITLPTVDIRIDLTGTHPAVWEAKVFVCMIELHQFGSNDRDLGWRVIGGIDARDPFEIVLYDQDQFPVIAETVKAYEALYRHEVTISMEEAPSI